MLSIRDYIRLRANELKADRATGRLVGWTTVGYRLYPDKACLVWPPRNGQAVVRVKLPLRTHGWIRWWLCPCCGRKTPVLYLPPGGTSFACRRCLKFYESVVWRTSGQRREPLTDKAWARWLLRRAREVLK